MCHFESKNVLKISQEHEPLQTEKEIWLDTVYDSATISSLKREMVELVSITMLSYIKLRFIFQPQQYVA